MAVYVDAAIHHGYGKKWCHLMADSIEELHLFAELLGFSRSRFQRHSSPHYDVPAELRPKAVALGAIEANRKQIVALIRMYRLQNAA